MVSSTNLSVFPSDFDLATDGGGSIFGPRLGTSISSRLVTRLPSFNGGGQSHFSSRGPAALVPGPPDDDCDCCAAIDIAPLGALKTSSVPATPSHRIAWQSNF